jgi:hypothetical protein
MLDLLYKSGAGQRALSAAYRALFSCSAPTEWSGFDVSLSSVSWATEAWPGQPIEPDECTHSP